MKSLFRILPLLAVLFLYSCAKENVTPVTPGVAPSVQVEYRVYVASSSADLVALMPVAGQANLAQQDVFVDRMNYSYSFEVTSGTQVSITAKNSNPGPEEVTSEIYVNGQLVKSATANAPGQSASVSVIAR